MKNPPGASSRAFPQRDQLRNRNSKPHNAPVFSYELPEVWPQKGNELLRRSQGEIFPGEFGHLQVVAFL